MPQLTGMVGAIIRFLHLEYDKIVWRRAWREFRRDAQDTFKWGSLGVVAGFVIAMITGQSLLDTVLYALASLALTILLVFLYWAGRSPSLIYEEQRSAIKRQADCDQLENIKQDLARFGMSGHDYAHANVFRFFSEGSIAADKWVEQVSEYIKTFLGDAYLYRFNSGAGVNLQVPPEADLSPGHRDMWCNVQARQVRLQEFIKELDLKIMTLSAK